ncbi:hypothetical protein ACHAW5_008881 [Stephanodiscus triporus]|uniref:Uncharacterized protein n=1 Tax=Stephanodiscus triporus TaxID=2934178 RepID=A0ABD3PL64_9STRA
MHLYLLLLEAAPDSTATATPKNYLGPDPWLGQFEGFEDPHTTDAKTDVAPMSFTDYMTSAPRNL